MISYVITQWMGSYAALVIVFWGIVYMIGCIVFVVLSPKICKGIFSGSSVIGTLLGGMLTSFAAGAMGTLAFAGATGMLGTGAMAKAAGALTGGAPGAGASGPAPGPALAANTAGPALSQAAGMAAGGGGESGGDANFGAFSPPSSKARTRGAVSEALNASRSSPPKQRFQPGTILGADGEPIYIPASSDSGASFASMSSQRSAPDVASMGTSGESLAAPTPAPKKTPSGTRLLNLAKGTAQIAKHTALAAGSGGSLGGYIQAHMALNKSRPVPIGDNRADDGVPDVIGRN